MDLPDDNLIENQDFKLSLISNGLSEEAHISCSCGVKIRLTQDRQHFSLSNYYKHIKSMRCFMMKKKKKKKKRMTDTRVNDESKWNDEHESSEDETSSNTSIGDDTRTSDSMITVDATPKKNTSSKRSSVLQSKATSKRQRKRK